MSNFRVEFREQDDRYNIRINPAMPTKKKYQLTEIINTIDNALFTTRSGYVMKDSYIELTSRLEEEDFTYVTVTDIQITKTPINSDMIIEKRDPWLIQIEKKLTVASITFTFKPDLIDLIKTIKGRFWSQEDLKWYVPLTELERLEKKLINHNNKYKIEHILNQYLKDLANNSEQIM